MTNTITPPRQELAHLKLLAQQRGISPGELARLEMLGNDGYGVISQLEQLYQWLAQSVA